MECEKQTKRKKEIRKTAHDRYLGGKIKRVTCKGGVRAIRSHPEVPYRLTAPGQRLRVPGRGGRRGRLAGGVI